MDITAGIRRSPEVSSFITEHTRLQPVPFVPEIVMHTASDVIELWQRIEADCAATLAPPFWAFPWAGGQGLARYVLDHPETVRDRTVLDLASGGGLVAIAARLAGARAVTANEIDPYADAAIAVNAPANDVEVSRRLGDLLAGPDSAAGFEVILAGDVFYSGAMAAAMLTYLRTAASAGATVLVGDPGRAYAPTGVPVVAAYQVPVIRDLEDADVKPVRVLHLEPC